MSNDPKVKRFEAYAKLRDAGKISFSDEEMEKFLSDAEDRASFHDFLMARGSTTRPYEEWEADWFPEYSKKKDYGELGAASDASSSATEPPITPATGQEVTQPTPRDILQDQGVDFAARPQVVGDEVATQMSTEEIQAQLAGVTFDPNEPATPPIDLPEVVESAYIDIVKGAPIEALSNTDSAFDLLTLDDKAKKLYRDPNTSEFTKGQLKANAIFEASDFLNDLVVGLERNIDEDLFTRYSDTKAALIELYDAGDPEATVDGRTIEQWASDYEVLLSDPSIAEYDDLTSKAYVIGKTFEATREEHPEYFQWAEKQQVKQRLADVEARTFHKGILKHPRIISSSVTTESLNFVQGIIVAGAALANTSVASAERFDWADRLAEWAVKNVTPPMSMTIPSTAQRELFTTRANVGKYQVDVSAINGEVMTVRDQEGYIVYDEKTIEKIKQEFESAPDKYDPKFRPNLAPAISIASQGAMQIYLTSRFAGLGKTAAAAKGISAGVLTARYAGQNYVQALEEFGPQNADVAARYAIGTAALQSAISIYVNPLEIKLNPKFNVSSKTLKKVAKELDAGVPREVALRNGWRAYSEDMARGMASWAKEVGKEGLEGAMEQMVTIGGRTIVRSTTDINAEIDETWQSMANAMSSEMVGASIAGMGAVSMSAQWQREALIIAYENQSEILPMIEKLHGPEASAKVKEIFAIADRSIKGKRATREQKNQLLVNVYNKVVSGEVEATPTEEAEPVVTEPIPPATEVAPTEPVVTEPTVEPTEATQEDVYGILREEARTMLLEPGTTYVNTAGVEYTVVGPATEQGMVIVRNEDTGREEPIAIADMQEAIRAKNDELIARQFPGFSQARTNRIRKGLAEVAAAGELPPPSAPVVRPDVTLRDQAMQQGLELGLAETVVARAVDTANEPGVKSMTVQQAEGRSDFFIAVEYEDGSTEEQVFSHTGRKIRTRNKVRVEQEAAPTPLPATETPAMQAEPQVEEAAAPPPVRSEEISQAVDDDVMFTESADLNQIHAATRQKYGDRDGRKYIDAADRLVNPNKNKLIEIRSNGVVVKEGGRYLFKAFTNTDANYKKWTLSGRAIDVSWRSRFEKASDDIFKQSDILESISGMSTTSTLELDEIVELALKSEVSPSRIFWNVATHKNASKETIKKILDSGRALFNAYDLTNAGVDTGIDSIPPKVYTRATIEQAEGIDTTEVAKMMDVVSQITPDLEVQVFETQADMEAAIGQRGNAFVSEDGKTIFISKESSLTDFLHETLHPVVVAAELRKPGTIESFYDEIISNMPEEVRAEMEAFAANYEEGQRKEEVVVEFLTRLVEGRYDESVFIQEGYLDKVLSWFSNLFQRLGLADPPNDLATLKDFSRKVVEAYKTGGVIEMGEQEAVPTTFPVIETPAMQAEPRQVEEVAEGDRSPTTDELVESEGTDELSYEINSTFEALAGIIGFRKRGESLDAHAVDRIFRFTEFVNTISDNDIKRLDTETSDNLNKLNQLRDEVHESGWSTGERKLSIGYSFTVRKYLEEANDFIISNEKIGSINDRTGGKVPLGTMSITNITQYPLYKNGRMVQQGKVSVVNNSSVKARRDGVKARITEPVAKFDEDIPNDSWLNEKVNKVKAKGRDQFGVPAMDTVTGAFYDGVIYVPTEWAAELRGQRGEQSNVRNESLSAIREIIKDTGKLPLIKGTDREYKPYIEVGYDGVPWVSEGNHRIMAANAEGMAYIPVEIRYFDGGQRNAGKWAPDNLIRETNKAIGNIKARRDGELTPAYYRAKKWMRTEMTQVLPPGTPAPTRDEIITDAIGAFGITRAQAEVMYDVIQKAPTTPMRTNPVGVDRGRKGVLGAMDWLSRNWNGLMLKSKGMPNEVLKAAEAAMSEPELIVQRAVEGYERITKMIAKRKGDEQKALTELVNQFINGTIDQAAIADIPSDIYTELLIMRSRIDELSAQIINESEFKELREEIITENFGNYISRVFKAHLSAKFSPSKAAKEKFFAEFRRRNFDGLAEQFVKENPNATAAEIDAAIDAAAETKFEEILNEHRRQGTKLGSGIVSKFKKPTGFMQERKELPKDAAALWEAIDSGEFKGVMMPAQMGRDVNTGDPDFDAAFAKAWDAMRNDRAREAYFTHKDHTKEYTRLEKQGAKAMGIAQRMGITIPGLNPTSKENLRAAVENGTPVNLPMAPAGVAGADVYNALVQDIQAGVDAIRAAVDERVQVDMDAIVLGKDVIDSGDGFRRIEHLTPGVRAILGEVPPLEAAIITTAKLAKYAALTKYYRKLRAEGEGKFLFADDENAPFRPSWASEKIPGTDRGPNGVVLDATTERLAPLSGMWTSPEIAKMLTNMSQVMDVSWDPSLAAAYFAIGKINEWATVFSPRTQSKNFFSNFLFVVRNGWAYPHVMAAAFIYVPADIMYAALSGGKRISAGDKGMMRKLRGMSDAIMYGLAQNFGAPKWMKGWDQGFDGSFKMDMADFGFTDSNLFNQARQLIETSIKAHVPRRTAVANAVSTLGVTTDQARGLHAALSKKSFKDEMREVLYKLHGAGLLGTSVTLGIIDGYLGTIDTRDKATAFIANKLFYEDPNPLTRAAKKAGSKAGRAYHSTREAARAGYSFGDDTFKIFGYLEERAAYADMLFDKPYYLLDETQQAEVDAIAIENVKNIQPNYDRIGELGKFFSRSIFMTQFISFKMEAWRTMGNSVALAYREIQTGRATGNNKMLLHGGKRMASIIAMETVGTAAEYGVYSLAKAGIPAALQWMGNYLFALDDDEDDNEVKEMVRELLPDFMQRDQFIPTSYSGPETGDLVLYSVSSNHPYGDFQRMLVDLDIRLSEQDAEVQDVVYAFMSLFDDFSDLKIFQQLLIELGSNQDVYGNRIVNLPTTDFAGDDKATRFKKRLAYTVRRAGPGYINQLGRLGILDPILPQTETFSKFRKPPHAEEFSEELFGMMTGLKPYKVNIYDNFKRRANDYFTGFGKSGVQNFIYGRVKPKDLNISDEEFEFQVKRMVEEEYATLLNLRKAYYFPIKHGLATVEKMDNILVGKREEDGLQLSGNSDTKTGRNTVFIARGIYRKPSEVINNYISRRIEVKPDYRASDELIKWINDFEAQKQKELETLR